jgi:exopolysaccharide production protein ExoQ
MIKNRYLQTSEFLLVFAANFLANFPTFFAIIWLVPQIVVAETILWISLTIFSIWILSRYNLFSEFLLTVKKNWFILPFLVFSGLSIIWSISLELSLYRWLVFICVIIVGGFIGLRFNLQEIIRLLTFFGLFVLILSAFFVFFVPDIGVMNYHTIQGAWKGLYWHKNHMGLMASLINILFLINIINSYASKNKKYIAWGILYLLSMVFIYKTDSVAAYLTTFILNGVIFLGMIWFKFRYKIPRNLYLIFVIFAALIALILFFNLDRFFGIFNRNTSLTGRIPMWSYLYNTYIDKRPLGGYGFNAFWYDETHQLAIQQAAGYPDPIIISDNGFIDIFVNTGYIGLFLFLIFYFGVWWRSVKYAWKATDICGFFPIIFMAYSLIANVSWSLIFENESFIMLTMVSILFCVSKEKSVIA